MARVLRSKRLAGLAAPLLAGALVLTGCGGAADPGGDAATIPTDTDSLVKQANEEGQVVWYTVVGQDMADAVAEAFMTKYPDIQVDVFSTTASQIYQRYRQEVKAGAQTADVFDTSVPAMAEELRQDGQFLKTTPPNAANIVPKYELDGGGYYYNVRVQNVAIIYNTDQLTDPAELPKTWKDLLDPKWKGMMATGNPNASGAQLTWAAQLYEMYGPEYFEGLAAQDFLVGQSIQDPIPRVISGERALGITLDGETGRFFEQDPVAVIYPEDGAVLMTTPSGVTAGGQNHAAGALFLDFLFTDEVSQIYVDLGYLPTVTGIEPPAYLDGDAKVIIPELKALDANADPVKELWRKLFGA